MFDFSFSEMALAGAVALVVLGPERLPKAARTAGEWAGRLRRAAGSLKSELAQHGEYAQLAQLKSELAQTADEIKQDLREMGTHLEADNLPPWERLPPQRTPADFAADSVPHVGGLHGKSLYKQAMARRRDLRPRRRALPRLRGRR